MIIEINENEANMIRYALEVIQGQHAIQICRLKANTKASKTVIADHEAVHKEISTMIAKLGGN